MKNNPIGIGRNSALNCSVKLKESLGALQKNPSYKKGNKYLSNAYNVPNKLTHLILESMS